MGQDETLSRGSGGTSVRHLVFRLHRPCKEAATERASGERLQQYIQTNYPNFGTRILAYEGGRNATGGIGNYEKTMENLRERHGIASKRGLAGILEEFDMDKDGKLSPSELQNYIQSLSRDEKGNLDKEGTARFLELFAKGKPKNRGIIGFWLYCFL